MSAKPLPLEQIAKLADDIRIIKDFAENHGFDTSLVHATVTPGKSNVRDWPLISLAIFIALIFVPLSILTFSDSIPQKTANFLLVIGMLFVVCAGVSAHKKFENNVITAIVCIGLIVVLLVGAGIFTPREAADRLQEMNSAH